MLKSFSDKAILTKIRAMFGRRLVKENYDQLLRLTSVSEVAAYLKIHPNYKEAMTLVDVNNVHRGQLESVLHRNLFQQYAKLVRFDFSGSTSFYHYMVMRTEVEQIITMLRLLNSGSPESYILTLPGYLVRQSTFDLQRLGKVTSYDELLEVLRHSRYYPLLYRCRPQPTGASINLQACEQALQTYYFKTVLQMVDESFSGGNREQLHSMILIHVDALNLAYAYRLKRFFKAQPDTIRAALLPFDTPSKKVIERIISAETIEEVTAAVERSRYAHSNAVASDLGYIESLTARDEFNMSRHNIRFSLSPPVVLVSYMTQLTLEIENITNIVEGIRYALSSEEIQRLLIM